jgi:DNA-binding Xre family transcriptional regulator
MSLIWKLKRTMVLQSDLHRASDLRAALAERAGLRLSLTSVSALINKKPEALRVPTMQAICNALNCRLSHFLEIEPDVFPQNNPNLSATHPPRLSDQSSSSNGDITFPDPFQFTTDDDY